MHVADCVGVHEEGLAVVFGDHVEDDAGDDEQEPDHAGVHEFRGDEAAQRESDDADDEAEPAEEGEISFSFSFNSFKIRFLSRGTVFLLTVPHPAKCCHKRLRNCGCVMPSSFAISHCVSP